MVRPAQAICSVGAGAGFAGDRIDPALDLVRSGLIDTIALECLAERTLVPAIKLRADNPQAGFDPRWRRRLSPLLPLAAEQGPAQSLLIYGWQSASTFRTNCGCANRATVNTPCGQHNGGGAAERLPCPCPRNRRKDGVARLGGCQNCLQHGLFLRGKAGGRPPAL